MLWLLHGLALCWCQLILLITQGVLDIYTRRLVLQFPGIEGDNIGYKLVLDYDSISF